MKEILIKDEKDFLYTKIVKKECKIISIVNQKGGVGKTTTAVNLSTSLAAINQKVLIIDMDPQGNAGTAFGLDEKIRKSNNIYSFLSSVKSIEECTMETGIKGLHIIPCCMDFAAFENEVFTFENKHFVVKKMLEDVSVKKSYDFIIIDCPPSLGMITINAMTFSDSIIIPAQCEFFSLEGLSHLIKTYKYIKSSFNENLTIDGIVLTMYDKRNTLTSIVEKDVRLYFKDLVYKTTIPRNVRLSEAPSYGKPAIIYDIDCPGSAAYIKLAKEIIDSYNLKITY